MAGTCNKNGIPRDGTSRLERLPAALKEGYVDIDEKSVADLVTFSKTIAKEFNYFDDTNTENGDWVSFFEQKLDDTDKNAPHFVLFNAFLEDLFSTAQNDLNSLKKKHLEFYYRDVLGFEEAKAVPDQVHLIIELAKHVSTYVLKKGTSFKAGKNTDEENIFYSLTDEFSFTHASLVSLKSIFVENEFNISTSPISNSADGNGAEPEGENPAWKPFGESGRVASNFGLAIESPNLRLSEGIRKVFLSFTFETPPTDQALDITELEIKLTGAKEWISPDFSSAEPFNSEASIVAGKLEIQFGFSLAAQAIIDFSSELHGNYFNATSPVAQILFVQKEINAAFDVLKDLKITQIAVKVEVSGIKNLIVQSEQTLMDSTKPMQIFGAFPVIGSRFYVGSTEIFSKTVSDISLDFEWRNIPTVAFATHYSQYHSVATKPTNTSFKYTPSFLSGNEWTAGTAGDLFTGSTAPDKTASLSITGISTTALSRDLTTNVGTQYQPGISRGYLAIQLSGSDFLHSQFQKSYGMGVLKGLDTGVALADRLNFVPNNPYTPEIENLTLSYSATETLSLSSTLTEAGFSNRIEKFYHVGPYGAAEQHQYLNENTSAKLDLVPAFSNEGELYLGFEKLETPQNLTLLIQVSEGSANPDLDTAIIEWSCLSSDQWKPIEGLSLLRDTTNGLLTSGLVTLSIPSTATANNFWLPNGYVWLRASTTENSGAVCNIIDIQPQAALAEFESYDEVTPKGETLVAETITKLKTAESSVKSVTQPYSSFGGSAPEDEETFFVRVSERLRHKNRAITLWDYERLVLAKFTDIYKVKCLNHTYYSGSESTYTSLKPGYVTLIVVPNTYNKNLPDPLKPNVSKNTLSEVKEYISKTNSTFVELEVQNPIYEEVELDFQVKFNTGFDAGIYAIELNNKLKELLSPWAYDNMQGVVFGGKVHKSTLVYQLEQLEYVDFVQCVKLYQISPAWLNVNPTEDLEFCLATTDASVLTSIPQHAITILEGDDCHCDDCPDNIVSSSQTVTEEDCGCNN